MPFVQRDSNKNIILVSAEETDLAQEFLEADNPELVAFLNSLMGLDPEALELAKSDAEISRVFEDLIDILINKGIVQFTDLPVPAQQKLVNRQSLRKRVSGLDLKVDANEELIRF